MSSGAKDSFGLTRPAGTDAAAAEDALVATVAAIGTPGFGRPVMAALAAGADADMCSAFALGEDGPEIVLAQSARADRSPFALIASLRYARRHWRRDRETLFNLGRAHRSAVLSRRSAASIRDLDYRRECYAEGAVGERLSVVRAGPLPIILNAYRDAARPRFPAEAADWFEGRAPLLLAAIERHLSLSRPLEAGALDPAALARRLGRRAPGLSLREADILARTAMGEPRIVTASALGLSVTSVATYRRRGYAKLAIRSRAELQALIGADAAPDGAAAPYGD